MSPWVLFLTFVFASPFHSVSFSLFATVYVCVSWWKGFFVCACLLVGVFASEQLLGVFELGKEWIIKCELNCYSCLISAIWIKAEPLGCKLGKNESETVFELLWIVVRVWFLQFDLRLKLWVVNWEKNEWKTVLWIKVAEAVYVLISRLIYGKDNFVALELIFFVLCGSTLVLSCSKREGGVGW